MNRLEKISLDCARGQITDKEAAQKIRTIIHQQKTPNPYLHRIEGTLQMKEQQMEMMQSPFAQGLQTIQKKAKKQKKPQPLFNFAQKNQRRRPEQQEFDRYVKQIQKESPLAKLWQDPKKGRRR